MRIFFPIMNGFEKRYTKWTEFDKIEILGDESMEKLEIKNLSVKIENRVILEEFDLEIKRGEIHAIMGPNGTGKSTLSKVIMGDPNYEIISGDILVDGTSILELTTDERARLGIFLAMQSPIEIEGVSNADFLKTAVSAKQEKNINLFQFIKKMEKGVTDLKMDPNMTHRPINQGFSGGERKRNEILQMKMLEPAMVILDEIDSGLDVDSLKIVGDNVMSYFREQQPGILTITHYPRILEYIQPDFVHIMMNGKIVKTGTMDLALEIEKDGYDQLKKEIGTTEIQGNDTDE